MKHFLKFSAVCLILSGCATIKDGQVQSMTVRTPGSENAKCFLENQDFKYVAYTDETINVMKSPHDIEVRCMAPGNRERTVLVPQRMHDIVKENTMNGVLPGAAYDYISRGAFNYPKEVVVDFRREQVKPYEGPDYETADLQGQFDPDMLEYMGPSSAHVPDGGVPKVSDLKKKYGNYGAGSGTMDVPPVTTAPYDPREEDK